MVTLEEPLMVPVFDPIGPLSDGSAVETVDSIFPLLVILRRMSCFLDVLSGPTLSFLLAILCDISKPPEQSAAFTSTFTPALPYGTLTVLFGNTANAAFKLGEDTAAWQREQSAAMAEVAGKLQGVHDTVGALEL